MSSPIISPVQLARYILGLSWVYHGFFPKLLHVAPLERSLTATLGLSDEISYLITKSAGVGEIIFGVALIILYRNAAMLKLNIFLLLALCAFVAIQMPALLIEAFNPVTTNFALIGLSYYLLHHQQPEAQ